MAKRQYNKLAALTLTGARSRVCPHYRDGMSKSAIARLLDISGTTVREHIAMEYGASKPIPGGFSIYDNQALARFIEKAAQEGRPSDHPPIFSPAGLDSSTALCYSQQV